ncbi:hypothetical protein OB955_16460 [Halobacteria archaeon AArc-m2/3/4]|uniref:Uncharacterized protein n=1 Tax=Natronoglomus mannanivorans TaxID=2979990 RepID=A0AAP2Z4F3_9EURY|nr:hypothetical protein [Halobacteria archaeon AArc-xg1-1]MCU4974320.1 hypothetical protein [Halobacteria archaeon AArc-m2/3/4]
MTSRSAPPTVDRPLEDHSLETILLVDVLLVAAVLAAVVAARVAEFAFPAASAAGTIAAVAVGLLVLLGTPLVAGRVRGAVAARGRGGTSDRELSPPAPADDAHH